MANISRDVRDYIENKVTDNTNTHIREYQEDCSDLSRKFRDLEKMIFDKLPKIKGISIYASTDNLNRRLSPTIWSYRSDKITEICTEFILDKSKQTKEWLDERIKLACLDINLYADELYAQELKEYQLLRRRVNNFLRK
jgi:hypothetical protein